MSETRERCAVCDFPLATGEDYAAFEAEPRLDDDAFERERFGGLLCWSGWWARHRGPAIDWRARALEAKRSLDCLRADMNIALEEGTAVEARVEALEGALREWARVVSGFRFGIESSRSADEADTVLLTFARNTLPGVPQKRDALKARVAELEAKAAQSPFGPSVDPIEAARGIAEIQRAMSPSPPVVVTREMVEALVEFARTWARFGADCEPENAAARLVVALGEALEVGT